MIPHFIFRPIVVALALAVACSAADTSRRPNIIWIMADDMGYGDLGCYGQRWVPTPHLDRMAAEGLRFTQFYAGATVCAPSRSVLMTGQHHGHTRVRGNTRTWLTDDTPQNLQPEDVTVADVLKRAGYATGLVGKWGLGVEGTDSMPTRHGFDFFFGYLNQHHAHNAWPEFLIRNEGRIQLRNKVKKEGKDYERFGAGLPVERVDYAPDLLHAEALKWIEASKERPFFLYYSPIQPHANNELTGATGAGQECRNFGAFAEKDWPDADKAFAAQIAEIDAYVGQLLELLARLKISDRTLVFFTSDNGLQVEGGQRTEFFRSGGPLRGHKRDLYEGGIRVPFLAWCPGRIAPGVSAHVGYSGDLMATAAELAGGRSAPNTDSISLVPTLLGRPKEQERHEYLYWEFHENGFKQAVRRENWKAVRHGTKAPLELYNLEQDIGETRNLAAQHPAIVKQLEDVLAAARTENKHWPILD
ncbi:MAG: arylsulfatase [Opitutaceae bacterium]|nr:arylsulfatase [Opitutaceae bacterium]